jgi:hypothetical protein
MKPERVFRIGAVSASVFVNEVKSDNGKREIRNVNLQRRYHDGEEWKSSSSFGLADLPQAIAILELAMEHVAEQEADVTPT